MPDPITRLKWGQAPFSYTGSTTAAGADVMKRIAAPMIGGLVTSFLLELLVYPAVFKIWKKRHDFRGGAFAGAPAGADVPVEV